MQTVLFFYGFFILASFTFLQDQGLDMISEGLDTLKNMAHDMNEVSCLVFWYMLHYNIYTCWLSYAPMSAGIR